METLKTVLIIVGILNMVVNIIGYIIFMINSRDIISSGNKKNNFWMKIGFFLLIFFLGGYLFVEIWGDPDLMTSLILLFGSVFVSIVMILLSRLTNTAKERGVEIAGALIGVIDARDPNLNGHSVHVKNLAMLFYRYLPAHLKITVNSVNLELAALMHDIGKLGVPEAILNKPAKLTDEEWEIMKTHPKVGVKLLKPLHTFDTISDWILYHHERIDGKGYYGKKGEELPLPAKLLSIVDTYSAITMRRSYKQPRTHEDAIAVLKEVAGTQLDKQLVDIFLTIPKGELEKCIPDQIKY